MANFWKIFDRLHLRNQTSDPSSLQDGDIWYNSTDDKFKFRENGLTVPLSGLDSFDDLSNVSFSTSVASSALTISLKTKAGTDPSPSDPVKIPFRNSSNDSGTYEIVTVTSAVSLVISSGSTLGHKSAIEWPIYIYAINNAGTVVLGASAAPIDDRFVLSTTAEGGAGAADSAILLYTTAAQTSKAAKCIGRVTSNQTTAGTWASNTTNRVLGIDPNTEVITAQYSTDAAETANTGVFTYIDFEDKGFETHPMISGAGGGASGTAGTGFKITFPVNGFYRVSGTLMLDAFTFPASDRIELSANRNTTQIKYQTQHGNGANMFNQVTVSVIMDIVAGDYTQIGIFQNSGLGRTLENDGRYNYVEIERIGVK